LHQIPTVWNRVLVSLIDRFHRQMPGDVPARRDLLLVRKLSRALPELQAFE
jgi:hypothetical protein